MKKRTFICSVEVQGYLYVRLQFSWWWC